MSNNPTSANNEVYDAFCDYLALVDELGPENRDAARQKILAERPELEAELRKLFNSEPGTTPMSDFQVGSIIADRYRVLQKLGEGGMGTVWLAQQQTPVRRLVALKVIKRGMDSEEILARFEAERQALAMMEHESIATFYDAGLAADGRSYFVMEFVPGVPITNYCDSVTMSLKRRLELFQKVCAAVQHAHQKGIIHRDLKPSNILVADQQDMLTVKIIDFGLAKALSQKLSEKSIFTEHGQILGTLQYMPPEQAELSALNVDTRADIYALGAVLYELISGTPPLLKEQIQGAARDAIVKMIRDSELPRPSVRLSKSQERIASISAARRSEPKALLAELRGDLDWIVLKALEKDRTLRYGSAEDLRRDLARYLHHEAIEARPPSLPYKARKWLKRHRVAASLIVVLVVALLATIAGISYGLVQSQKALVVMDKAKKDVEEQRDNVRDALLQKQRTLAEVYVERGVSQLQANDSSAGFWNLWRAYQTASEHQDLKTSVLNLMSGWSRIPEVSFHNRWKRQLAAFSPHHNTLLTTDLNGDGLLWNSADPSKHVTLRLQHHPSAAAFNEDESLLVTGDLDGTVRIWDTDTGSVLHETTEPHRGLVRAIVFQPGGNSFVSVGEGGYARVWNSSSGKPNTNWMAHDNEIWCAAFSADGSRLVTGSKDYTARLWDADSGNQLGQEMPHMGRVVQVVLSQEGDVVISASDDGSIHFWDGLTGRKLCDPVYHVSPVECLEISDDGQTAAAGFRNGSTFLLSVSDRQVSSQLPQHSSAVVRLAFSSDGTMLLTACENGQVNLWNPKNGTRIAETTRLKHGVQNVEFVGATKNFFTADEDGVIRLWEFGDTQTTVLLRFPSEHKDLASKEDRGDVYALKVGEKVDCVEYCPLTCTLAVACADGDGSEINLYTFSNGEFVPQKSSFSESRIHSVCFSPDGRILLAGSVDGAQIFDAKSMELVKSLGGHDGEVWTVVFRSDSEVFLTADIGTQGRGGTVRLWDGATFHQLEHTFRHPSYIWSAKLSSDGVLLATGCEDGLLRLWDTHTGKLVDTVNAHHNGVWSVAFSPNDRFIATGGGDEMAKLWRVERLKPYGEPLKHLGGVWSVDFDATGQSVITGSWDNSAQIWDAATCLPKGPVVRHGGGITNAWFTDDGKWAMTSSWDGFTRMWSVAESMIEDDPQRILLWIEVQTGLEMGGGRPLSYNAWNSKRLLLAEMGGSPFQRD